MKTAIKILYRSWTAKAIDKGNPNKYRIGIKQAFKVAKMYKRMNIKL